MNDVPMERDGQASDDATGGAPDPDLAALAMIDERSSPVGIDASANGGAASIAETPMASAAAPAPLPTSSASPIEPSPNAHALLEALDRDGHVRQSWPVLTWPLTIGRALDNDIVLSEPHVAPHHLRITAAGGNVTVTAGDTRNGALIGNRRIDLGHSLDVAANAGDVDLKIGRTRLRLRLPGDVIAPELVMSAMAVREQRFLPSAAAAILLIASVIATTWLESDPDGFVRAAASTVLATLFGAGIWCGGWALLSKTITRQSHFGWHVRVFLIASLVLAAQAVLTPLAAFAFSAPWISSYDFIGLYVIGAAAIYFHLLGVEPARERLMRGVAVVGALVGIGVSMWFNVQRSGRTGDELYMNHLFPPALRVAKPKTPDQLVDELAPMQAKLDRMARDPNVEGDDGSDKDGEDD